ncbi:MAG: 50S ribosomal protein L23 [Bacilli bacterium]|nr:50S ribosomal protein L23 [Bacilli bacterium]
MADEKEVVAPVEEAPKKTRAPKKAKKEVVEEVKKAFAAPVAHDFEVIREPLITEKTMALMQNANKVTIKVADKANKIEIKDAFERIFQVKVVDVKVVHKRAKLTTRGGRYQGTIPGFKKAIVTLEEGTALDLFAE